MYMISKICYISEWVRNDLEELGKIRIEESWKTEVIAGKLRMKIFYIHVIGKHPVKVCAEQKARKRIQNLLTSNLILDYIYVPKRPVSG